MLRAEKKKFNKTGLKGGKRTINGLENLEEKNLIVRGGEGGRLKVLGGEGKKGDTHQTVNRDLGEKESRDTFGLAKGKREKGSSN